jgi:neutral ceramidase
MLRTDTIVRPARVARCAIAAVCVLCALPVPAQVFKAGFAKVDITPARPTPMGGYGARGDALSTGVRDPLFARALVIEADNGKLALVGMDNRRAPTHAMMEAIKAAVRQRAGVDFVMIVGTHTHHGPIIELRDEEGMGRGKFDDAIAYGAALPGILSDLIVEAAERAVDARMGFASTQVDMNRNRHSQLEQKPVDQELAVIRLDDLEGNIIALAVNYAAHPTMLPADLHDFSADWPGAMMNAIEERLGAESVFFQGACGDLSTKRTDEQDTIEAYGAALAEHAVALAESIETRRPDSPSVAGVYDTFTVPTRVDFSHPLVVATFRQSLFPELANALLPDVAGNTVTTYLATAMINGQVALVGISGEPFAALATRLKERSRADMTLVFGFCNEHRLYHPTIEGAAEGGYGGDAQVAWVELGTGERMMDRALVRIYGMMGAWAPGPIPQPPGALGSPTNKEDQ